MVSDHLDAVDGDDPTSVLAQATGDAGNERVAASEAGELGAGRLGDDCEFGARHDRRERAVDVEEEGRPVGGVAQRRQQGLGLHASYNKGVALAVRRWPSFVAIGVAAGFFSALFGVGGGVVVVPALIMAARFGGRTATGTSLAAIAVTAFFGVASFAVLGEVHWAYAAMVGIPAMVGTVLGTTLQQRVSSRLLVLLFAAFLVAVAVRLFLE